MYSEADLMNAFMAGYDKGQDDAKDDVYGIKAWLRSDWEQVRADYGVPTQDEVECARLGDS